MNKQQKIDRPDREKIAKIDYEFGSPQGFFNWGKLSDKDKSWYLRKADRILALIDIEAVKREEMERIMKEVRRVGQDIGEDGNGTDKPEDVVDTIWYIGEGRLKKLEQALSLEEE